MNHEEEKSRFFLGSGISVHVRFLYFVMACNVPLHLLSKVKKVSLKVKSVERCHFFSVLSVANVVLIFKTCKVLVKNNSIC
jgi:hypothetical protein